MAQMKNTSKDFIKFLGTAGARFVMIKQLRASGGIWIYAKGTNILVDPGPGSIVRCSESKPRLDPSILDGIVLTHKHLDHSNDINVMIEAMTQGGFKKRGVVFCPKDAIGKDPVILRYARKFPERIIILEPERSYRVKNFVFSTSMQHKHTAKTYGLKFRLAGKTFAILADTRYFKELERFYKVDVLILSVVFLKPRKGIDHLSVPEAELILKAIKPKKTVLTHFGMEMVKANPGIQAKILSKRLGIDIVSAYDGMVLK